ncbi:hypothetical protein GGI42DRAFT_317582 [Trichoderma sp. SZMC 28013]
MSCAPGSVSSRHCPQLHVDFCSLFLLCHFASAAYRHTDRQTMNMHPDKSSNAAQANGSPAQHTQKLNALLPRKTRRMPLSPTAAY